MVAHVEDAEEFAFEQRVRELREPREGGAKRRQPIRAGTLGARRGQRADQGADTGLLVGRHRRLARRYRARSWSWILRVRFGERVDRAVGIDRARGLKRVGDPHGPE